MFAATQFQHRSGRSHSSGYATIWLLTSSKPSLYFPEDMLRNIEAEAVRLGRSMSWVVQRAWRIARREIKKMPSSDA